MKDRAFILSGLLASLFWTVWFWVLWFAIKTKDSDVIASIAIGSPALVAAASTFAACAVFKGKKWQAACGSLAITILFISVIAVGVAWHHFRTTQLTAH
jgi:hypothetical protein